MPERYPREKWADNFRLHYVVGSRGVEPKLLFNIKPIDANHTWTFHSILDKIILGPSISSLLAQRGIQRMLETIGKPEFREKVSSSQIPLRPVG